MAPDCATTLIVAVPRFTRELLADPLQPPTASPRVTIAATMTANCGRRRQHGRLRLRHIARLSNAMAANTVNGPSSSGIKNPKCEALADVVTVRTVLAAPLAGVTAAGVKLQATPATGGQENEKLFADPPEGTTVHVN